MPRRFRYAALAFFATLLSVEASLAQSAACTDASFEKDEAATFEACTARLKTELSGDEKAEALRIRGRAAHRLGRVNDAIADYELALSYAPKNPELHVRRGWTHYDKEEFEEALTRAAYARELDPGHAGAFDLAGSVMFRVGELDRAQAAYDEALRLRPNSPVIRYHRYELFDRRGNWPAALAELEALLALPVADIAQGRNILISSRRVSFRTAASLRRASLLVDLGRKPEAERVYDQLIIDDASELTLAMRASHQFAKNDAEAAAQADVDAALRLDPNYWLAHEVQGFIHHYAKRYDAAAAAFARAVSLKPDYGKLRWWHAQALRRLNRLDQATSEALAALDVDPGYIVGKKMQMLARRGYFQPPAGRDPKLAMADAIRACMLDEECW